MSTPTVYICFDGAGYVSTQNFPAGVLFILPTSGRITGTFGAQTATWPPAVWHGQYYAHFHNGVDFGVIVGTPVYAAARGVAVYVDGDAGGTEISIYHTNGMRTVYAHLSSRIVADGAVVAQGDLIALSGDTGVVTGPHLHWGMVYAGSPENPLPFTRYTSTASTALTGGL